MDDYSKMKTIPDFFYECTNRYSERDSLSYSDENPFTYKDVLHRVRFLSNKLLSDGFQTGEKVAILSENSPSWVMAYFSISCAGGVVVPILPDFHQKEVENILEHSEASRIFVSKKYVSKIKDVESKYKVMLIEDMFKDLDISSNYNESFKQIDIPTKPEDLACIIYTSGTTGSSKGVMLSHRNILSNVYGSQHIPPLRDYDRALSVLPLAHTYEGTLGLYVPFLRGATIFYLKKPPSTSVLLPALKQIRPGMILTVPLLMEKIYAGIKTTKIEKSKLLSFMYKRGFTRFIANKLIGISLKKIFGGRLRFYGIGGAPLSEETEIFLRQASFPYAMGYGLTETAPLLAGDNAQNTKFRSTGRFLKDVEYKLDSTKGEHGNGEVVVRGPNIMMGYYKDPEKTKEVLSEDGWFRTGDLGVVEKGYLTIKGRIKNIILGANGENIYPDNIESLINKEAFVEESLVFLDEQTNTLVAKIHINYENFSKYIQGLSEKAGILQEDVKKHIQGIKERINSELGRFSRIAEVLEQKEPFIKTPTLKIKRFLHSNRSL